MSTRSIRFCAALACALAALALPVAASAAPDPQYEPNDGIQEAYGPLTAGTDYDARLSTSDDKDWFVLYVSGGGVLDLALTNVDDSSDGTVYLNLLDQDGNSLNSIGAGENSTEHLSYTLPGAGQYYVVASSYYSDNDYRLSATGPLTTGPTPGPPDETVPNNNQDISTAFGPLAGDRLYGGRIDVNGEEDWFTFYTAGPGPIEIATTNIDDESGGSIYTELYDGNGTSLDSSSAGEDGVGRIQLTGAGAARYYLRMGSYYNGNSYQFKLTPASLFTSTPPAPPAPATPAPPSVDGKACRKTERKLERFKSKLKRVKAKKRSASGKKAKRRAKAKVRKVKKKVRKARKQMKATC